MHEDIEAIIWELLPPKVAFILKAVGVIRFYSLSFVEEFDSLSQSLPPHAEAPPSSHLNCTLTIFPLCPLCLNKCKYLIVPIIFPDSFRCTVSFFTSITKICSWYVESRCASYLFS